MRPMTMRLGKLLVSFDDGLLPFLQMPAAAANQHRGYDEPVVREVLSRQEAEELRDWLNDYLEG